MKNEISVIIPTYNDNQRLYKCIKSFLSGSELPSEIIVVDDGSEIKPKYDNKIVKIFSQKNKGPASARNQGVKLAKTKFIYFTDADCWVEKNTIKEVMNLIVKDKRIKGIAGPYNIEYSEVFLNLYSNIDLLSRYQQVKDKTVYVHGTYNLILRRDCFSVINGFDEKFKRPSGEDFDLVARYTKKFGGLTFCQNVIVNTEHEIKIYKYLRKQFYRGFDRAYLYQKNIKMADYYTMNTDALSSLSIPIFFISFLYPIALYGLLFDFFFFLKKIFAFNKIFYNKFVWFKVIPLYMFNALRFFIIGIGFTFGIINKLIHVKN